MTETFKNTFNNIKAGWEKIEPKKKRLLILGAVLGIILIIIITSLTNRTNYAMLFNNLEINDAARIVADIETKKIPYKLENGGRTILIDEGSVDTYRMDLAMQNLLPDSSTGFEIFDDTGIMVTDEDRQIMYQRALTGELQRSIVSLDAVNTAKVHLVMSEKSIFDSEEKLGSASIIVDLKPNQKVSDSMVRGIASLVSGAVKNIPITNIQVIDSAGNLLSGFMQENGTQSVEEVLVQHRTARNIYEKEMETKLNSLLGRAFGYDKIKVAVLAELDFNAEESTTVSYSDPVTRSEQISVLGGGMGGQDVTGGNLDDNISNIIEGNQVGGSSSYSRVLNNELTTETKNVVKAPGMVDKITTSVLYDGILSIENKENIENIVAATIGYDEDRGDVISVVGVMFTEAADGDSFLPDSGLGSDLDERSLFERYKMLIIIGGGVLLFLLIAGIIIISVRRKKRREEDNTMLQEEIDKGLTVGEAVKGIEDIVVKPDYKVETSRKYAQQHPDLTAELIKSWIKE